MLANHDVQHGSVLQAKPPNSFTRACTIMGLPASLSANTWTQAGLPGDEGLCFKMQNASMLGAAHLTLWQEPELSWGHAPVCQ